MLLQVGKWGPLSRKVDLNGNPATVCKHEGKGATMQHGPGYLLLLHCISKSCYFKPANSRAGCWGESALPGTMVPYYTLGSLLCLTGLAQLSSCRTQSYTLHSFSHICTLILHCYSWEIFSTWLQSPFLWSLVMNASGTNESVVRTSANADMCSKLSDSGMTSVRWAY